MNNKMLSPANVSQTLSFWEEVQQQRWDDHRYYHQSRVNQTLHLLSALTFLVTYALIPFYPLAAALLGWVVAMWVRQIGHFFFEPRGFDSVNGATFQHKEEIKVGFNLHRKVILLGLWAMVPVGVWAWPALTQGTSPIWTTATWDTLGNVWIALALLGLMTRTIYLCATRRIQTGAAWMFKILTDPFHDIKMYWQSPWFLMKGQLLDPMEHVSFPPRSPQAGAVSLNHLDGALNPVVSHAVPGEKK